MTVRREGSKRERGGQRGRDRDLKSEEFCPTVLPLEERTNPKLGQIIIKKITKMKDDRKNIRKMYYSQ